SGGFALRARRCWEYQRLCEDAAQRLSLSLDLRVPGTMDGVDATLARHRPGKTPLLFQLIVEGGASGRLDLNGSQGVRVDAELAPMLRALPGVRAVRLALARPWASAP